MVTGRSSLVVRNLEPTSTGDTFSRDELISKGRDLVAAVESRDGWRTVNGPSDLAADAGQVLVFKKPPPQPYNLWHGIRRKQLVESIKEWGDASTTQDVGDISKLADFKGSDFSYLLSLDNQVKKHYQQPVAQAQKQKGKGKRIAEVQDEEDTNDAQPQKKRRRINDDTLHTLIPVPHHHPYRVIAVHQRSNIDITKHFPPYSKSPFLPIAPFTSETAERLFKDPFARTAWVIPIEGSLPWEGATPAHLIDDPSTPIPQSSPRITWSPFVANKLWSDLLDIRKKNLLGVISLSYHVAPTEEPKIVTTTYLRRTFTKKVVIPPSDDPPISKCLEQCSYVKVYHDVRYAMYVRSVLDAWKTAVEGAELRLSSSVPGASRLPAPIPKTTRVRPLQGTKLVLLDEIGQAVGVC